MSPTPPAEIGMPVAEVDTPALVVDLDAFERNLHRMARALDGAPARLRAHAKTHKCPAIALRQIELGAVGVCCQKVSEAEAMVDGGVEDVLVSNEVVGRRKLERLAALSRRARIAVCADDPANVAALDEAARAADAQLTVLVEIDNGAGRCGIAPGAPAVELARRIDGCRGLEFGGLQAYQGSAQHLRSFDERRAAAERATALTAETVDALDRAGLACAIVGGAGTGTFRFEAASGVYNELQAGSYVFMDADYGRNLGEDGGAFDEFEHSLFVVTTVMSRPTQGRAVVDAGHKSYALDSGLPSVAGRTDLLLAGASDEHGVIVPAEGANAPLPGLGEHVWLVPGHCDPTVNLHDWYVGVRGDRVECLWPIAARGALF